jgi:hypothetical protein
VLAGFEVNAARQKIYAALISGIECVSIGLQSAVSGIQSAQSLRGPKRRETSDSERTPENQDSCVVLIQRLS